MPLLIILLIIKPYCHLFFLVCGVITQLIHCGRLTSLPLVVHQTIRLHSGVHRKTAENMHSAAGPTTLPLSLSSRLPGPKRSVYSSPEPQLKNCKQEDFARCCFVSSQFKSSRENATNKATNQRQSSLSGQKSDQLMNFVLQ